MACIYHNVDLGLELLSPSIIDQGENTESTWRVWGEGVQGSGMIGLEQYALSWVEVLRRTNAFTN